MKLLPLVISTTLLTIFGFASYIYIHLGGNKEVDLKAQDLGPYKIIFSHHVGPYHKILDSIEPIEKWSKENNTNCDLSFGEYLDDTDSVAEERLQSNGGCIVGSEPKNLPSQFTYREIPRRFYLTADFDGAPSITPMKVYPKALRWIKENNYTLGGPVIEIYSSTKSNHSADDKAQMAVHTQVLFPLGPKKP